MGSANRTSPGGRQGFPLYTHVGSIGRATLYDPFQPLQSFGAMAERAVRSAYPERPRMALDVQEPERGRCPVDGVGAAGAFRRFEL